MKRFNIAKWLLFQCEREDDVGVLARQWVQESKNDVDCDAWLSSPHQNENRKRTVEQARQEFAMAVQSLDAGHSSATFPRLFASEDYDKKLESWFKEHQANPNVSSDEYLRRKHLDLDRAMEGRILVYLDTNHWVNMVNVVLESPRAQPAYRRILERLTDLTVRRKVLCPISFPLFQELLKQTDPDTRCGTARLMDRFSGGVCFQFPHDLQILELRRCAAQAILASSAPDYSVWTWTKVGYLNGELLPRNRAFSEVHNNLVQKVSIDMMWALPLEHFIEFDLDEAPDESAARYASATNQDANWYRQENIPFPTVLEHEKAYLIQGLTPDIRQIFEELMATHSEKLKPIGDLTPPDAKDFNPWNQPSLQVVAGINAALITVGKKFSANDMLDLQHAALAVPYCDALFCDRRMAHILRTKPLDFAAVYSTSIFSSPDEITAYLESLV